MNDARRFPTDQRGAALPMAMLVLLVLSVLVVGFSAMSASEPTIASNQLLASQARFLAEAGVERAIWALQNPGARGGLPSPLPHPVPAPFDGSQLVPVSTPDVSVGGFRVSVTTGGPGCPTSAERCITSVGWAPGDASGLRTAHRKLTVTANNPQLLFKDPPAAVMVRGDLQVAGNVLVDARTDSSCGGKAGTVATGTTDVQGQATDVRGAADGNDVPNEVTDAQHGPLPAGAHDIVRNLATSSFDQFAWSDADINFLRAYAKAHGTYLRGPARFDSTKTLPNGLVFVDTFTGTNITREGIAPATPTSDFADVSIRGNASADPSGVFRGWLFVNGSLSIDGTFPMRGLVYTQDDISYHGLGAAGIDGALIGRNIRAVSSTSIDSALSGRALINYNCVQARTGSGTIPDRWTFTPGTYKELCDSCS
jgi:hypothetical protein